MNSTPMSTSEKQRKSSSKSPERNKLLRAQPPSTPSRAPPTAKRVDQKQSPSRKPHVQEVQPPEKLSFTRTFESIMLERSEVNSNTFFDAPADFPDAIWSSFDDAKRCIQSYCADVTTTNGAFAVIKSSTRKATSVRAKKGDRQLIRCACYGASQGKATDRSGMSRPNQSSCKSGCQWGVWIEKATEGWVRSTFNEHTQLNGFDCHSHDLAISPAQQAQFKSLREIPSDLVKIAEIWQLGGMKPSTVYHKLCQMAASKGRSTLFTLQDVQNLFRSKGNPMEQSLDCTNLYQYLQARVAEDGRLQFKIDINGEGELDKIFLVMSSAALDLWQLSEKSVLLFDTKHGTNRYGLRLGLLSCIDSNGRTQVLATSFVTNEDTPSFRWVFAQFGATFGSLPKVIFTDSDKSMAAAIKAEWQGSIHLLCTFHIWKNFYQHIHPMIQGNENWKKISNHWWRLCKESDEAMRDEFDAKWECLVALIRRHSTAEAMNKKLGWLQHMSDQRQSWAACYTWSHCTFGIHSTARAEALHSSVAHFASKHSSVVAIVSDIEVMCSRQQMKSKVEDEHRIMFSRFNDVIGRTYQPPSTVNAIAKDLVPFARHLLLAQASQMVHYDCLEQSSAGCGGRYCVTRQCSSEPSNSDIDYSISETTNGIDYGLTPAGSRTHVTTLHSCSCQFPTCWRLPCRHMLRLILHLGSANVPAEAFRSMIAPLWFSSAGAELVSTAQQNAITATTCGQLQQQQTRMTKADRKTLLLSTFRPLADIASHQDNWTSMVNADVTALFDRIAALSISASSNDNDEKHQPQNKSTQVAVGIPEPVLAATSCIETNRAQTPQPVAAASDDTEQCVMIHDESHDEIATGLILTEDCATTTTSSDEDVVLANLGQISRVGNPKDKKDKNQNRVEPKQTGAPTTRASKIASRHSRRKRTTTAKMAQYKNRGRTPSGKQAY